MGFSTLRAALFGLTVLASATSATISLSNFTPRIDKLPSQCDAVYNSKISGCVEGDFIATGGSIPVCSPACFQGLVRIQDAVLKGCAGVDVGETSIIGVFQNGLGLRALCPGVTVTTKSSSTTPSTTTQVAVETSTEAAATTTSFQMVLPTSTPSSTLKPEDAPSSSTPTGVLASTLSSSTVSTLSSNTAISSAAGANPSLGSNSQLSNAGSGGGSPFDVVAMGSASRQRILNITVSFLVVMMALLVAWI